jgi:hypothetical protein
MEPNNNRLLVGVGVVAAVVLVLGGAWFVAPFLAGEPEPPKVVQTAPAASGKPARAARPQLGGGPVMYASEEGGAPAPRGKAGGGGRSARQAGREEKVAEFNTRLDEYAQAKGWDAQTTDGVRNVVMETVKGAHEAIAEARQAKDRELARAGLKQLRDEQSAALNALLGPEESAAFVQEMDFGQYFPRVAERRGGRSGAPQ